MCCLEIAEEPRWEGAKMPSRCQWNVGKAPRSSRNPRLGEKSKRNRVMDPRRDLRRRATGRMSESRRSCLVVATSDERSEWSRRGLAEVASVCGLCVACAGGVLRALEEAEPSWRECLAGEGEAEPRCSACADCASKGERIRTLRGWKQYRSNSKGLPRTCP